MTTNPKSDIDSRTLYILDKIRDEYEVIKRQGFPSQVREHYSRPWDATITERRWHAWANELNIDYLQLQAILMILQNEGLLEKFEFISEYI